MRNRFDEQLAQLNTELITMGALCEEAIGGASCCLLSSEEDGAGNEAEVFAIDRQIDQKERDIENLCMRLLLQQTGCKRLAYDFFGTQDYFGYGAYWRSGS